MTNGQRPKSAPSAVGMWGDMGPWAVLSALGYRRVSETSAVSCRAENLKTNGDVTFKRAKPLHYLQIIAWGGGWL